MVTAEHPGLGSKLIGSNDGCPCQVKWWPKIREVGLARATHFMYTTAESDLKTLEDWGFHKDPFVYVLRAGACVLPHSKAGLALVFLNTGGPPA